MVKVRAGNGTGSATSEKYGRGKQDRLFFDSSLTDSVDGQTAGISYHSLPGGKLTQNSDAFVAGAYGVSTDAITDTSGGTYIGLNASLAEGPVTDFAPPSSTAAAFLPGNIVVYRIGSGVSALNSSAAAVFLDEYTPAGVLVQSIPMPTADNGANQMLTASGTATSEGLLTRSADGRYLILTGYDAAVGTASVATTATTAVQRVVGRVDASGNIDTSTTLGTAFNGNGIRSAASLDGSAFWVAGGSSGVAYASLGQTSSTIISSTFTNLRGMTIYDGQLYTSAQTLTLRLGAVGTGTPTTGGETITNLPGIPTGVLSPHQFFFADLSAEVAGVDTLYVSDDRAGGSGGVYKYSLVGGNWVQTSAATTGIGSVRGLIGSVNGTSVSFYATTTQVTSNFIVTFTDSSGYNAPMTGLSFTLLAQAATNTVFRGIALAPFAPSPGSLSINDVTQAEGNSGTTNFTFTVTRSGGSDGAVAATWTLAHGTTSNDDFTTFPQTGTVSFAAGETSKTITIAVAADTLIEGGERFFVNLTNPTGGATISDAQGHGIIYNDDAIPAGTFSALGDEFLVNTHTGNAQAYSSIAALPDGGYVIAWTSHYQDGNDNGDIYAQRYSASGAKVGGEFHVNTVDGGDQTHPVITVLGNGSFVIAWASENQDSSGYGVYAQLYNSAGSPVGGNFPINSYTNGNQQNTGLAALADGGFVVTWQSEGQDGNGWGIYGRLFDNNGASVSSEFRVNTATLFSQETASVTALLDGGFVVAWTSEDPDASYLNIYGQRFDSTGAMVGGTFSINSYSQDEQVYPSVAALDGGGFVVTWSSLNQDYEGWEIYAQRFNAAGSAVGGEFRINATSVDDQLWSSVTALAGGGFFVTWSSWGQDGSDMGVYGQRFDASGARDGAEILINQTVVGDQLLPLPLQGVTQLSDGSIVAIWNGSGAGDNSGVFGRHFGFSSPNHAPVGADDSYTVDEDNLLSVDEASGLLANDNDSDGNPLTVSLVSGVSHGVLNLNSDGSFTYTPDENYHGTDSFTYTVTDGTDVAGPMTVTITVNSVNDAPEPVGDSYTTNEDTPLVIDPTFGLLANDRDPDGDVLTASIAANAAHGVVLLSPDGSFTYTPAANYNGPDSFTYTVSDGITTSAPITVNITVDPVNDVPDANPDNYTVDEDVTLVVGAIEGVLNNDTDIEPSLLSAVLVSGPAHGSLNLNSDGSFTYTPDANYYGSDSFTYCASDGAVSSNPVTVTLTINAVNDGPKGFTDDYTIGEDGVLTVGSAGGVLANDTDPENDHLTATLVANAAHGNVVLNSDGSFTYTPNANFNGIDSFTYSASDGIYSTDPVTVTIDVSSINDAPTISNLQGDLATYTEDVNTSSFIDVGRDSIIADADSTNFNGGSLTVSISSGFVAARDRLGIFQDGVVSTSGGNVTVNGVLIGTVTGNNITGQPTMVLTFTTDNATLANVQEVLRHVIYGNGFQNPVAGTREITVTLVDGDGTANGGRDATVYTTSVNVIAVNDAPVLDATKSPALANTQEDAGAPIGAVGSLVSSLVDYASPLGGVDNVTDADGPSLGIAVTGLDTTNGTWFYSLNGGTSWNAMGLVSGGAARLLLADADTRIYFQPNANYSGTLASAVTFRAWDGSTGSNGGLGSTTTYGGTTAFSTATDTASLTVLPVNDAPTISNLQGDVATFTEGGAFNSTPTDTGLNAVISDVDNANFNGGSLRVRVTTGLDASEDRIFFDDSNPAFQLSYSGNTISYQGVAFATFTPVGPDRTFTFNVNATPAAIQALVRSIVYVNIDTVDPSTATRTVEFTLNDGSGGQSVTTSTVNVIAINDAPYGVDGSINFYEDNLLILNDPVYFGFGDGDGNNFAGVWIDTVTGSGSFTLNGGALTAPTFVSAAQIASGLLVFTPAPNANGNNYAEFAYRVVDDGGTSGGGSDTGATNTRVINIIPVNDPAIIGGTDTGSVTEDGTLLASGALTITDIDSSATFQVQNGATTTHGSFSVNASGAWTYQLNNADPAVQALNTGQTLTDIVQVLSADGTSHNVTITIHGADENTPPVGVSDAYSIDEDGVLTVGVAQGVLANDTDAESNPLTASIVTNATHGTVVLNSDGSFTYTPTANYNGSDSFTYRAFDGTAYSNPVTVTLSVSAVNDAPTVTISPSTGMIINQSTLDTNSGHNISSFVQAENFSITGTSALSNFTVYLADIGGTEGVFDGFSGALSFAIYSANGAGLPGTLLFSGTDIAPLVTDTGVNLGGRDIFQFAVNVGGITLSSGNYWIALHEGAWLSPADGTDIFWVRSANDTNGNTRANTSNITNPNGTFASQTPGLAFSLSGQAGATEQISYDMKGRVTVSDIDAGSGTMTVTLSVGYGVLNVSVGTSGATLVSGNGTASVVVSGTLAQLNALLGSDATSVVSYLADTDNPPASTTFSVSVNDNGNTGSGGSLIGTASATINITPVNDAPVLDLNGYQVAGIDTTAAYTEYAVGVKIAQSIVIGDSDNAMLTGATVTIASGFVDGDILRLNTGLGAGITGNYNLATGVLTLTGTASVAAYQAVLSSLQFKSASYDPGPSRDIVVTVTDGAATSAAAHIGLTITEINNAPVNNVPISQSAVSGGTITFSTANGNALSVSDLDAGNNVIRVKLLADHGTINIGSTLGVTVVGNGTGSVLITGTLPAINAALNGTTYHGTPGYAGADTLTMNSNDRGSYGLGGQLTDSDSIAITWTPAAPSAEPVTTDKPHDGGSQVDAGSLFAGGDSSGAAAHLVDITVNIFETGPDLIINPEFLG